MASNRSHGGAREQRGGSFSEAAWARTSRLREEIDRLPFLISLEDGSLPRDVFTYYLAQDAHYLSDYGRALSLCAGQATDPDELVFWATSAAAALQVERQLHAGYVHDLAAADKSPTCTAYTSYLLSQAARGGYPALAAALLPCFWIYQDVGVRLLERAGDVGSHPYGDWISQYGDPGFAESTRAATRIVDRIAAQADAATVATMHDVFEVGVRYEWMFWDAASRQESWPV